MKVFILLFACFEPIFGSIGFDTIQTVSVSAFQCLQKNNFTFFIGRTLKSDGSFDETGIQNLVNARLAGWPVFDGYIFPCLKKSCPSAHDQTLNVINKLREVDAQVNKIWIDVEPLAWPADKNQNRQFISEMLDEINKWSFGQGVYTNHDHWDAIVGANWTAGSYVQLWWNSNTGFQDFKGFKPFGGWTRPHIHQYSTSINGPCGVTMNRNWFPF